jgi:23S rRNA pseudouridine1911/1915/1917 synthase
LYQNAAICEMKTPSWLVGRPDAGRGLLDFVAAQAGLSNRAAKRLLDERRVVVNGRRVWMAHHRLAAGDRVDVPVRAKAPPPARVPVLARDGGYLVADKPAGILSNGPRSAEALLRESSGWPSLRAVHRLDRDTSGCLLAARDGSSFDDAVAVFRGHRVGKLYHVLVAGAVRDPERVIRIPIEGQEATSRVRRLDWNENASHLAVRLETGRTHQIRRHLAAIGHPVLGDRQYAAGRWTDAKYLRVPRQMLHAARLVFPVPRTDRVLAAESPLPEDFRRCLAVFRLR